MKRLPIPVIVLGLSAVMLGASLTGGPALQAGSLQAARPAQAQAAAPGTVPAAPNDAIRSYCVGCHNDTVRRGELSLAAFDVSQAADRADVAEKVIR
jgi:hypothetical protein